MDLLRFKQSSLVLEAWMAGYGKAIAAIEGDFKVERLDFHKSRREGLTISARLVFAENKVADNGQKKEP